MQAAALIVDLMEFLPLCEYSVPGNIGPCWRLEAQMETAMMS
jgi:hypothetical protein